MRSSRNRDPLDDIASRVGKKRPDIELTPDFQHALRVMENTSDPILLTGEAGTGKSTLLECFRDSTRKKVAVVAPTGVAAMHIGGQTIHSFFRFPPAPISTVEIGRLPDRRLYQELDSLVIDEVSMVRADMIDGIDRFLRLNREAPSEPFGGVQLIMVGDPFQLPPVVSTSAERHYMRHYGAPYFFAARAFSSTGLTLLDLREIFRQQDATFVSILNAIRTGTIEESELALLNERVDPDFSAPEDESWVMLTTTNRMARAINSRRMTALETKPHVFEAEYEGKVEDRSDSSLPVPTQLVLRQGTQVMFVRNDPLNRWVNGTMGRVHEIDEEGILVMVGDDLVEVEQEEWQIYEHVFDTHNKRIATEVVATYQQYPIRPAYAITIHKSQGKTFERAIVDLGSGAFAHGQTYVALSRLVSLEGLILRSPVRWRDLIVDPVVLEFTRTGRVPEAEWPEDLFH